MTDEGGYGRFGALSRVELERFFYLDDEDRKLVYGLTSYSEVEPELAAWVADQAWVTGDGPKAMFAGAVDWLRKRQALLRVCARWNGWSPMAAKPPIGVCGVS
ncbi:hypothetical protein ABIA39_005550 [Nocardia sp. GAS34]|uniref:hypothetical protein n=1 Tax=unclassified Nocardia TaxID=2637762 RepID=UPI003D217FB4